MRYISFFLAFGLLLFIVVNTYAQDNKQVRILLKNGVKIKGALVESFDEDKLKVSIDSSSNLLVIPFDRINNISFKGYGRINDKFKKRLENPPSLKVNSFYNEIRGGLMFGEDALNVALHSINGYQFSKYLGTAVGIGVNKYGNYVTMPLYAQIKGYLSEKKVSPFYFGDIGYGFAWKTSKNEDQFELDNLKGGLYWQLGLGYQINFYNSSMTFSLGYVSQDSKAEYVYYRPWDIDDVEISERRLLRRVVFSVGFLF